MDWDFLGDPVIKNSPCNSGNVGLILDWGTKIPYATEKLSPCITATEPVHSGAFVSQLKSPNATNTEVPVLWRPQDTTRETMWPQLLSLSYN